MNRWNELLKSLAGRLGIIQDGLRVRGEVTWELFGPDGQLKRKATTKNLVIINGDNYVASRIYSAAALWTYYMKLGESPNVVTKATADAYLAAGDYLTGTAHAMDATWPKVGASANIAQFVVTWAPTEGTAADIYRASIVDNAADAAEGDATHTLATALLPDAPINKGAADTLVVTWNITFLGA